MQDYKYLVTGQEMRAYDTYTIEQIGIPALVLMERAALSVVQRIMTYQNSGKVLCVCGTGNNGGDGLAVARMLLDKGFEVEVALIGDVTRASKETETQLSILEKYGVCIQKTVPEKEFAIIVDALFGTGLSRQVQGAYLDAITAINACKAWKIAVDIPSGICADTGAVLGDAVKADETLCLAFQKRGVTLYPGAVYAGQVHVADIGINERSFGEMLPRMHTYTGDGKSLLPKRTTDGNKGTFGKLLIVAGSPNMAGAGLLSALGAYRMGAGMVKLAVPEANRVIVQEKLPEALLYVYEGCGGLTEQEKTAFAESMQWADALVIGPGLSQSESACQMLKLALREFEKPLLIDADGLNLLAKHEELQVLLRERGEQNRAQILTPHMGELARLLSMPVSDVTREETASTIKASKQYKSIVAGKSARTHVCKTGEPLFLNSLGNDRMATAGSGDVLSGIIGALLASGMDPFEAAKRGVVLHALAGDAAAAGKGNAGLLASDIAEGIALL